MSMVAHGYGLAAFGSPHLIFSNVIWGWAVGWVPQFDGTLGYSIATFAVLTLIGATLLQALWRVGLEWFVAVGVALLVLVRTTLFPQFTVNAGLLTASAVLCWMLWARERGPWALWAGVVLAVAGFLIRGHVFALVMLVGLPFLPWRALLRDREAMLAVGALSLAVVAAAVIDDHAYRGDDWQSFHALNQARAPITDFGADQHLKNDPALVARHGYTANDIDLLRNWFFVDDTLTHVPALNAMLKELGPLPSRSEALSGGWEGVATLVHPVLLPGVVLALLLALSRPDRRVFAA